MTDYAFDMQLVVDPFNTANVVANGQVYIYAAGDTLNSVPLTLTDRDGVALSNPMFSNSYGFLQAFVTGVPQVKWVSGEFGGFFNSYVGLRDAALAAVDTAAAAVSASLEAGASAAVSADAATQAAADAAVIAAAAGGSNVALDTDGVPYFFA